MLTIALGEHVTRALRELEASSNAYRTIVERDVKLRQIMKRTRFTAEEEQGIVHSRLGVVDTCISKDIMLELRQEQPSLGTGRPYFFFSHNPVICGLFQFALLLNLQREAFSELNASGYGLSVAHLYNATRTENYLTTIWPDMEKMIELREGELFAGGTPKTVDQYISNILRVNGVSIVNFAKDSRSNWKKKATNGPRQLETPEIMESFKKLLCKTDDTPTDISMDLIEAMLHKMAQTQSVKRKEQGLIRERWQRNHTLTPIELLKLLEQCMAEEEPKLAFNYFAIYQSSFLLLASIKVELGTEFTNWLDREFPNHDSNDNRLLRYLPYYVFGKLPEVQKKSKAATTEDNILARVGRVIDDFVCRKAKDPSPTIAGGFNDQDLTTDFEHGTQNGVCIHWGRCDRTAYFANQKSE